MPRVTWDELKEMYPNDPEHDLAAAAKEQGIEVPEVKPAETEEAKDEEVEAEDTSEEEPKEPEPQQEETEDEEEVLPRDKKGLIDAKRKERERRKAAEAETAQLRKELEELRKAKAEQNPAATAPQAQSQPSPQTTQPTQNNYFEQLQDIADAEAKKQLGLAADIDLFELQMTDPKKFMRYNVTVNTIAMDLHQQNVERGKVYQQNDSFLREVQSEPEFTAVMSYAEATLDDMPRKEAKKIDAAYAKLSQRQATKEDIESLKAFYGDMKAKYNEARGFVQKPVQQPAPQAAKPNLNVPRSQQLRTGSVQNISEAEIDRMFNEDPQSAYDKLSQNPALLEKYKRGLR